MTKRQAILAAIAGAIGLMSSKAKTENLPGTVSGTTSHVFQQVPQTVSFDLKTFAKFTFYIGDETVTVTGREIFEALKAG